MAGSGGREALTWDARGPLGVRGSRKLVWWGTCEADGLEKWLIARRNCWFLLQT